jgi:uncharacterized YigZ family protein
LPGECDQNPRGAGVVTGYPDTIAAPVTHELIIRKSRFIAHLAPVSSVAEAEQVIAGIRKRYWDARHNCVAMVTGLTADQARSSDDGEPAGTAGAPMLAVLQRRNLTDVVAVVTRYFGGIKLGAGGLIRAYSGAVGEAADLTVPVRRRLLTRVTVAVPHADAGRIDNFLRGWVADHESVFGGVDYAAGAEFELWIPPSGLDRFADELAAISAGALTADRGDDRVLDLRS